MSPARPQTYKIPPSYSHFLKQFLTEIVSTTLKNFIKPAALNLVKSVKQKTPDKLYQGILNSAGEGLFYFFKVNVGHILGVTTIICILLCTRIWIGVCICALLLRFIHIFTCS